MSPKSQSPFLIQSRDSVSLGSLDDQDLISFGLAGDSCKMQVQHAWCGNLIGEQPKLSIHAVLSIELYLAAWRLNHVLPVMFVGANSIYIRVDE